MSATQPPQPQRPLASASVAASGTPVPPSPGTAPAVYRPGTHPPPGDVPDRFGAVGGSIDDGPTIVDAALARPRVLLVGAALGALLGLLWVLLNWSSYTMSARVALRDPWEADLAATDRPVGGDFERFVRSQVRFAGSDQVLDDGAAALGITRSALRDSVTIDAGASGDVLSVVSHAAEPAEAERRLNGLVDAYARQRALVVQQQAQDAIDGIEAELEGANANNGELRNRASQLRISVASYGTGIAFVESDPIRAALSRSKKVAFPVAGAIVGLGTAVVAAWVLADRRPRIDQPAVIAARRGVPFIGTVPTPGTIDPRDRDARVASDAVLLALANQLRGREPRHGGRAYCVVLAPSDPDIDAAATAHLLAAAAIENGANAAVFDVAAAVTDAGGAGFQVDLGAQAAQAADRDLLLFACAPAAIDVSVLRLGLDADAALIVTAVGGDLHGLDDTFAAFERAGLRAAGLLAIDPPHRAPR